MKNCPDRVSPEEGEALFCDTRDNSFPAKKQVCQLCMAGFIISLVSIVSSVVMCFSIGLKENSSYNDLFDPGLLFYIAAVSASITLAASISGLAVSIRGAKKAKKLHLDGCRFGIMGIIISVLTGAVVITTAVILIIILSVFASTISSLAGSVEPIINYQSQAVRYINYKVCLNGDKDKACITTWYWSGDPNDNILLLPEETPDGAQVMALGDRGRQAYTPADKMFRIELAEDRHNYCLTSAYKESEGGRYSSNEVSDDPAYYGILPGTEVHYEVIVFTVNLGRYISQVDVYEQDNYFIVQGDDGIITIYKYYLHFECDEENEKLYVEKGVVFRRKKDELESRPSVPTDIESTVVVVPFPDTVTETDTT